MFRRLFGLYGVEPLGEVAYGHGEELRNGTAADFYVFGVGTQTGAMAGGAYGFATVAGEHDAVLYLVALAFYPVEKAVDAFPCASSVPEDVELFGGETAVGGVDGEVDFGGEADEVGFPFGHLVATPADNGVVVDGEAAVGDDEVFADARGAAVAAAGGAGTVGVVEAEEVGVGFFESDAVGLEAVAEELRGGTLFGFVVDDAGTATFEEGCLDRFGDAGMLVVVAWGDADAVDKESNVVVVGGGRGEVVVDEDDGAFDADAHESFLTQHLELRNDGMFSVVE